MTGLYDGIVSVTELVLAFIFVLTTFVFSLVLRWYDDMICVGGIWWASPDSSNTGAWISISEEMEINVRNGGSQASLAILHLIYERWRGKNERKEDRETWDRIIWSLRLQNSSLTLFRAQIKTAGPT